MTVEEIKVALINGLPNTQVFHTKWSGDKDGVYFDIIKHFGSEWQSFVYRFVPGKVECISDDIEKINGKIIGWESSIG